MRTYRASLTPSVGLLLGVSGMMIPLVPCAKLQTMDNNAQLDKFASLSRILEDDIVFSGGPLFPWRLSERRGGYSSSSSSGGGGDDVDTLTSMPSVADGGAAGSVASFKVDLAETDKEYVVRADVPGVKKDAVKVSVEDGNILAISAERRHERHEESLAVDDKRKKGDQPSYSYSEVSYGKVYRAFKLPSDANTEGEIAAKLDEGVLTITLPKKDPKTHHKKKQERSVQVQ